LTASQAIGIVAAAHIQAFLDEYQDGLIRFCIEGLSLEQTSAIALGIQEKLPTKVEIHVPESLASAKLRRDFPELVSTETAAHWRHSSREKADTRAIIFGVTDDEMKKIGNTMGEFTRLNSQILLEQKNLWTSRVLELTSHQEVAEGILVIISELAIAQNLGEFATYVLALKSEWDSGRHATIDLAANAALNALSLPKSLPLFRNKKRQSIAEITKLIEPVQLILVHRNQDDEEWDANPYLKNLSDLAAEDLISAADAQVIHSFLKCDLYDLPALTEARKDLVELDWQIVAPVFDTVEKKTKKDSHLGQKTIAFFDEFQPDLLTDKDRDLLESVKGNEKLQPAVKEFYSDYEDQLRQADGKFKKLATDWERHVHRKPIEYEDFLEGILCSAFDSIRKLDALPEGFGIRVSPAGGDPLDWVFWGVDHNPRLSHYLRCNYRGLDSLLPENVELELDLLLQPHHVDWKREDFNHSPKAAHNRFNFETTIIDKTKQIIAVSKTKFVWSLDPESVACSLPDNLIFFEQNPDVLPYTHLNAPPTTSKGDLGMVTLDSANSFQDATGANNGVLLSSGRTQDMYGEICSGLDYLVNERITSLECAKKLKKSLTEFRHSYSAAIREVTGVQGSGAASEKLLQQGHAYGKLCRDIRTKLRGESQEERVWRPLLRIGVTSFGEELSTAIAAPWHPLKLVERFVKFKDFQRRLIELAKTRDPQSLSTIQKELIEESLRPDFYPAVLALKQGKNCLLIQRTSHCGYSTFESMDPVNSSGRSKDHAKLGFKAIEPILNEYLTLQPHQNNNFAIAVCINKQPDFANKLIEELQKKTDKSQSLKIEAYLVSDSPNRLYELRNSIVDETNLSDNTCNQENYFNSQLRLRVCAFKNLPTEGTPPPIDILILDDLINEQATLTWDVRDYSLNGLESLAKFLPSQRSNRKPVDPGDKSTTLYLTPPNQPREIQDYLNLIYEFDDQTLPDNSAALPCKRVKAHESDLEQMLLKAHKAADWVVCYDSMVDRKLLRNLNIDILRYIDKRQQDFGVTVSTTHSLRFVKANLKSKLKRLFPERQDIANEQRAEEFIKTAQELSGHLIMRSAHQPNNAAELMGVVLSMDRLKACLKPKAQGYIGWFSLDDYTNWIKESGDKLADILAIFPSDKNGVPSLRVFVIESKFVATKGGNDKKSREQTLHSFNSVSRVHSPNLIESEAWRNRIGNLMQNGMSPFRDPVAGMSLMGWIEKLRNGEIPIEVYGQSHVFVYEDPDQVYELSQDISGCSGCSQEIFGPEATRAAIEALVTGMSPEPLFNPLQNPKASTAAPTVSFQHDSPPEPGTAHVSKESQGQFDAGDQNDPSIASGETEPCITTETSKPSGETEPRDPSKEIQPSIGPGSTEPGLLWLKRWAEQNAPGESSEDEAAVSWLEETAKKLSRALAKFEISRELLDKRLTPNAGILSYKGSDTLDVPSVEKIQGRLLTTYALEVINVEPAPGQVNIHLKRPKREVLSLPQVWLKRDFAILHPEHNMSFLIGVREQDGEPHYLYIDGAPDGLDHAPHTLIAGESGSGKGVLTKNLLLDICALNSPKRCRIKFIDPKRGVDYKWWLSKLPHLDGSFISDQESALKVMAELVEEMDRRYILLDKHNCDKIQRYNSKVPEAQKLPTIWLFHDELADWMLQKEYQDQVKTDVNRLGVKARAAGIHLVLITQRPDNRCLPDQLRANLGNKLVLKVADAKNSKIALDEAGAERLLGRGHIVTKLNSKMTRAQVPFLPEDQLDSLSTAIAEYWKEHA
jgi:DNA segregation ATPase FtsK/SpoIIIE, S-DNA-T family